MINYYKFSIRKIALLLLGLALFAHSTWAQSVLLSPTGAGGFELGTGSLLDNGWTAVTNPATPKDGWFTGSGLINGTYSFPSTSRCAYVSGDNGTTWSFSTNGSSIGPTHIYTTLTVPAGETDVTLSFKHVQNGTTNTKLMVYVCPSTAVPTATEPQSNGGTISAGGWGQGTPVLLFLGSTPQSSGTRTFSVQIPPSFLDNCNTARTFKLVFTSFRNSTSGNNPPPAVDEISVVSKAPVSAAPGIFTINNTQPTGATNFNNFTDAINWLNASNNCGISNPITFNVQSGQIFNENPPYITASGTTNFPITFQKIGTGANPVIRPTGTYVEYMPTTSPNPGGNDFGICLHGADFITFDGIDITSNNAAGAVVEYGYLIRNGSLTNGANNNTIKNVTVLLDRTNTATRCVLQSATTTVGGGFSALALSGANNNNKYYNLTLGNTNIGIQLYGSSTTNPDIGNEIGTTSPAIFNIIGRPAVANDIGNTSSVTAGINVQNQQNTSVFNNRVNNVTSTSTAADGISFGTTSAGSVFNGSSGFENKVYNNFVSNIRGLSTTSTSALVTGIRIQHDNAGALGLTAFKIFNNVVSKITTAYSGNSTTVRIVRGIFLQAGNPTNPTTIQYELIHNTVVIDGSLSPNASNTVFEGASNGSILKFRNNLFVNKTGPQAGLAVHSILGVTAANSSLGAAGSLSNYNNFYLENPTNGNISFINNIANISAWRSAYAGQGLDVNSLSVNPMLNNDDLLYPLYTSPIIAACPTLSSPYNKDVVANNRRNVMSTIGAYEQSGDQVAPIIKDTIIWSTTSTSNRALNGLLNAYDEGSIVQTSSGLRPRIYFKKSTEANTFGLNNSSTNGWKWVEANNTTTPFSFNFDYSLLNSPLAIGDLIQYFFVAQDTVAIPNLASLPSAGFIGTTVANITQAPTSPKTFRILGIAPNFIGAMVSHPNRSKVETGSVNQVITRVALQLGTPGDSSYVSELVFNSSLMNDLANISAAKVWYTGTSANFNTSSQFGTTRRYNSGSGSLGNFSFTGAQLVPSNSIVYFWLTYDINSTAVTNDSVDADVVSVTHNFVTQTLSGASALGARTIKSNYCTPALTTTYCVSNVIFNTLSNPTSTCALPAYTNFAPVGAATTTVRRGTSYNLTITQTAASTATAVFFDFNDNGVFDVNEIYNVSPVAGSAGLATTVPITIPCDAVISSEIRMRVRAYFSGNGSIPAACATSPGEIEDYTISIEENTPDFVSSSATQYPTFARVNSANLLLMRLPIVAKGCSILTLNSVNCNTNKTTLPLNSLLTAKLYSTGRSSSFKTDKLLASVNKPNGSFVFNGFNDTLLTSTGDTNFFWIAYDLTSSANLNDTIDVRIDSMNVGNRFVIPSNNNPVEYSLVRASNVYSNSEVIIPNTSRTPRVGQDNTPILRVRIVNSTTGAPLQLTQFNLATTGGGIDTANIQSVKIYYTAKSSVFATANLFGSQYTQASASSQQWSPYSILGNQLLSVDTNYFWITYQIKNSARLGDSVNAVVSSFIIDSATYLPTVVVNNGGLIIRPDYCFSAPSGTVGFSNGEFANAKEDLSNVTFNSISNSSTCLQTGGIGSVRNQYSNYSESVAPINVLMGSNVPFSLTGISNCNTTAASTQTAFTIYIDWNQDGDFLDVNENPYRSASAAGVLTGRTVNGSIVVPCGIPQGLTRMRVIYAGGTNAVNVTSCGSTSYQFGETEDYTLNVQNNPANYGSSVVSQLTGLAGRGSSNVQVLRVAVKATGCGNTPLDGMYFRMLGTTNNADVTLARLYYTGTSNIFNTNNNLASVSNPSGAINFTSLGISLINNNATDTNYFWLTYDIAQTASTNNVVDAVIDSILTGSTIINLTANGNPSGNLVIAPKMSFVGANAIHPDLSAMQIGSSRQILRVNIQGSSGGAAVSINNLTFNVNGSGNANAIIDSAILYYTGSSSTFATTTKVGASYSPAPANWGVFTFNAPVQTQSTDNYFWLVYKIKSNAPIGDSVDAELVSLDFDNLNQTPSAINADPDGVIKTRGAYCASSGVISNFFGGITITSLTLGGTTTTSACAQPSYTDNSTLGARNVQTGLANTFNVTVTNCNSTLPSGFLNIYVDLNQNGDFSGAGELVYSSSITFGTAAQATFTIPCSALLGLTRLRIITSELPIATACGNNTAYGETEDYLVNISGTPIVFASSSVTQSSGLVAQGGFAQQILGIKVKVNGCGLATVNNMFFNTSGSTNPAADIASAKLYTTKSNPVFTNPVLLGSYPSPSGQFDFSSFNISDTLGTDTNYYWLTYDISASATNNNTVDARLDSIIALGLARIPSNGNPSGSKTILAPLQYSNTFVTHTGSDRVAIGASAYQMLLIKVVVNSTGAPIKLTAFNLNTNGGGADVTNIESATLYYTGNSSTFSTVNRFGNTYNAGTNVLGNKWLPYTISGDQDLVPDTNYFWLTYKIRSNANLGDAVDAELTGLNIAGNPITITSGAPSGNAIIRQDYCYSTSSSSGRCIDTANVGSILNVTGVNCSTTYTLFANSGATTTNVNAGSSLPIYLTFTAATRASIFIDLNKNGVFDVNEEYNLTPFGSVASIRTSIQIPTNALLGETRMRIRTFGGSPFGATTPRACADWNNSETEDYTITILPAQPQTTYVWNRTTPGDFALPTNWIPNRVSSSPNDRLVFSNDTVRLVVNGVFNQAVKSIELSPKTKVVFNSGNNATITVIDSLIVNDSTSITTDNNVILQIGQSASAFGIININGNFLGINGKLKRWVGSGNLSGLLFPIANRGLKQLILSFTSAPTAPGTITVSFEPTKATGFAGFPLLEASTFLSVNRTCAEGYWMLTPADGLMGGLYDATFTADSISGLTNASLTTLINREDIFDTWKLNGNYGMVYPTSNNSGVVINRTGMYGYGQFAIASDSILNQLPVSFISFDAKRIQSNVVLTWKTASEINNRGFELLRSYDGVNYSVVAFVNGKGNQNTQARYSYTDMPDVKNGRIVYYKIKQIDYDGKHYFTEIRQVLLNNDYLQSVSVYPNPFSNILSLDLQLTEPNDVSILIHDIQGRFVMKNESYCKEGLSKIQINTTELKQGFYFATIKVGTQTHVVKLIKE